MPAGSKEVEIYFSVLQRKALTPTDFASLEELAARLLDFQARYEKVAAPFDWRFTREDLRNLMTRLAGDGQSTGIAA